MSPAGYVNTNALHAAVAARALAALGVRVAVVSPGSRSTPLAHALAKTPGLTVTPVLDERTAAFFALGHAKATGLPAALLCTSGTAAANHLPAVVEARLSRTPLIVITADRPPEMRDCASGQTIDQTKLFGHFPVWSAELATPETRAATTPAHWRNTFVHAVERALAESGPVHLNAPFRDPLAPHEAQPGFAAPEGFDLAAFTTIEPMDPAGFEDAAGRDAALNFAGRFEKVLLVAGAGESHRAARLLAGLRLLGRGERLPILADSLSSLRGLEDDAIVTAYEFILREPDALETLRPDAVIRIGQPPTGKTLRRVLETWDVPTLVLSPGGENLDPLHRRARTLRTSPARWTTERVFPAPESHPVSAYAIAWLGRELRIRNALTETLRAETVLREPHVADLLSRRLPPGTPLFVANSMPVRDTETWMPAGAAAHPVIHNRGANGIDGTLGTALGAACALGRHTVVLTGDLSLLHDTNAFLLAPRLASPVTVVLVNNGGGGIFNHLAVATHPDFEELWATPQRVDFATLAAAYGVPHRFVPDLAALESSLGETPPPGLRILEIRTDRASDAAWRKSLAARIAPV